MQGSPETDDPNEIASSSSVGKTDWARLAAMTGEEALQIALADPDNPPLTDEQLSRGRRVPDPQAIRKQLGLTQKEFSRLFQIALGTLRDWEQGARRPDSAAKAYLRVIQQDSQAVINALQRTYERAEPGWQYWQPTNEHGLPQRPAAPAIPLQTREITVVGTNPPQAQTATSELPIIVYRMSQRAA